MWSADMYFLRGHLQAASVICSRGLGEKTRFYQQCPQQANQVAFRQCLEFSKRLMLLSWLKWVRFIFAPSCISQSLPVQSLQTKCATAGDSHLYNEGQGVNLWPQTETEEESNCLQKRNWGDWSAAESLLHPRDRTQPYVHSLKKQGITVRKNPGHETHYTSLGLSQVCECW